MRRNLLTGEVKALTDSGTTTLLSSHLDRQCSQQMSLCTDLVFEGWNIGSLIAANLCVVLWGQEIQTETGI